MEKAEAMYLQFSSHINNIGNEIIQLYHYHSWPGCTLRKKLIGKCSLKKFLHEEVYSDMLSIDENEMCIYLFFISFIFHRDILTYTRSCPFHVGKWFVFEVPFHFNWQFTSFFMYYSCLKISSVDYFAGIILLILEYIMSCFTQGHQKIIRSIMWCQILLLKALPSSVFPNSNNHPLTLRNDYHIMFSRSSTKIIPKYRRFGFSATKNMLIQPRFPKYSPFMYYEDSSVELIHGKTFNVSKYSFFSKTFCNQINHLIEGAENKNRSDYYVRLRWPKCQCLQRCTSGLKESWNTLGSAVIFKYSYSVILVQYKDLTVKRIDILAYSTCKKSIFISKSFDRADYREELANNSNKGDGYTGFVLPQCRCSQKRIASFKEWCDSLETAAIGQGLYNVKLLQRAKDDKLRSNLLNWPRSKCPSKANRQLNRPGLPYTQARHLFMPFSNRCCPNERNWDSYETENRTSKGIKRTPTPHPGNSDKKSTLSDTTINQKSFDPTLTADRFDKYIPSPVQVELPVAIIPEIIRSKSDEDISGRRIEPTSIKVDTSFLPLVPPASPEILDPETESFYSVIQDKQKIMNDAQSPSEDKNLELSVNVSMKCSNQSDAEQQNFPKSSPPSPDIRFDRNTDHLQNFFDESFISITTKIEISRSSVETNYKIDIYIHDKTESFTGESEINNEDENERDLIRTTETVTVEPINVLPNPDLNQKIDVTAVPPKQFQTETLKTSGQKDTPTVKKRTKSNLNVRATSSLAPRRERKINGHKMVPEFPACRRFTKMNLLPATRNFYKETNAIVCQSDDLPHFICANRCMFNDFHEKCDFIAECNLHRTTCKLRHFMMGNNNQPDKLSSTETSPSHTGSCQAPLFTDSQCDASLCSVFNSESRKSIMEKVPTSRTCNFQGYRHDHEKMHFTDPKIDQNLKSFLVDKEDIRRIPSISLLKVTPKSVRVPRRRLTPDANV